RGWPSCKPRPVRPPRWTSPRPSRHGRKSPRLTIPKSAKVQPTEAGAEGLRQRRPSLASPSSNGSYAQPTLGWLPRLFLRQTHLTGVGSNRRLADRAELRRSSTGKSGGDSTQDEPKK